MEDLGTTVLLYLYYFGRPAIMVASLIIGIVIICTKDKITKLLGAVITIESIGSIMEAAYVLGLHFIGSKNAIYFTYAKSIVAITAGFASGILLYLYAKKRYGTKLITGIILIVGSNTISSVFGFIFNKVASNIEFNNPAQYSYLMTSVSTLIVLAFSTVWFIIFFKNRRKENELKLLWLKRVLAITSAAFALVMNIYFFFALNGNPSHAEIYENQNAYDIILMIGSLVVCVLGLLMDIYIVVKGRKASKDNELEIVGE